MIKCGVSKDELLQEVLRGIKSKRIDIEKGIKRLYDYGIDVDKNQIKEYLGDM